MPTCAPSARRWTSPTCWKARCARQGEAVRISVQLVRTRDGFEVWSQSYDGDLSNIFDLQERIARAITDHLKIVLTGSEQARLVPVATTSAEAYADFVTAQDTGQRALGDSLPRAIALLQQATALDPKFARAWAKLAVAYAVLPQYTGTTGKRAGRFPTTRHIVRLTLDPGDGGSLRGAELQPVFAATLRGNGGADATRAGDWRRTIPR